MSTQRSKKQKQKVKRLSLHVKKMEDFYWLIKIFRYKIGGKKGEIKLN